MADLREDLVAEEKTNVSYAIPENGISVIPVPVDTKLSLPLYYQSRMKSRDKSNIPMDFGVWDVIVSWSS
jgi:hypothetical protein